MNNYKSDIYGEGKQKNKANNPSHPSPLFSYAMS